MTISKSMQLRKLICVWVAALSLLPLSLSPALASAVGQPVPKGTSVGQTLRWNGTSWVFGGLLDTGTGTVYVGNGATNTSPANGVIQATGVAGGQNAAGGNLILSGGASSGYYSGGDIIFMVADSNQNQTVNTPYEALRISSGTRSVAFKTGFSLTPAGYSAWSVTSNYNNLYFSYGSSFNPALTLSSSAVIMPGRTLGVNVPDGQNPAGQLDVRIGSSGVTGQIIKEAAGQSADALNINTSVGSGGNVLRVTAAGALTAASTVNASGYQAGGTAGYTGNIPSTAQNTHYRGGLVIGYTASDGSTVGQ